MFHRVEFRDNSGLNGNWNIYFTYSHYITWIFFLFTKWKLEFLENFFFCSFREISLLSIEYRTHPVYLGYYGYFKL